MGKTSLSLLESLNGEGSFGSGRLGYGKVCDLTNPCLMMS